MKGSQLPICQDLRYNSTIKKHLQVSKTLRDFQTGPEVSRQSREMVIQSRCLVGRILLCSPFPQVRRKRAPSNITPHPASVRHSRLFRHLLPLSYPHSPLAHGRMCLWPLSLGVLKLAAVPLNMPAQIGGITCNWPIESLSRVRECRFPLADGVPRDFAALAWRSRTAFPYPRPLIDLPPSR
jgi:hypothetical protein